MDEGVMFFIFLSVGALALFSFLAVLIWSMSRQKEREGFYRAETVKKIAESGGAGSEAALEYLREQEKASIREERAKCIVAGWITTAVGVALMIFLHSLVKGSPVYLSGLFPLLIGLVLIAAPRLVKQKG